MYQHKQRYFHARHHRPSPAIKWHHAARVRIRFGAIWSLAGFTPPAARSAAAARSRTDRRAPAECGRAPCAPRSTRAGGTSSQRPRVSCGSTRRDRDRAHTTPLPVAAVAAPPCSRRSRRPPCADPSPMAAMTLGGSAARNARPPQRGQLPRRTPCSRNRAEPRKGAERRAGTRNLRPFRIPVQGSPSERTRKSGLRRRLPTATCGSGQYPPPAPRITEIPHIKPKHVHSHQPNLRAPFR